MGECTALPINISTQLRELLIDIRSTNLNSAYALADLAGWKRAGGSKILRTFLKRIDIDKHVTFHTLRSCFATHLLATGADPTKVMRMGGWRDLKTFQIYIRLAGVDVRGVSEALEICLRIEVKILLNYRRREDESL